VPQVITRQAQVNLHAQNAPTVNSAVVLQPLTNAPTATTVLTTMKRLALPVLTWPVKQVL